MSLWKLFSKKSKTEKNLNKIGKLVKEIDSTDKKELHILSGLIKVTTHLDDSFKRHMDTVDKIIAWEQRNLNNVKPNPHEKALKSDWIDEILTDLKIVDEEEVCISKERIFLGVNIRLLTKVLGTTEEQIVAKYKGLSEVQAKEYEQIAKCVAENKSMLAIVNSIDSELKTITKKLTNYMTIITNDYEDKDFLNTAIEFRQFMQENSGKVSAIRDEVHKFSILLAEVDRLMSDNMQDIIWMRTIIRTGKEPEKSASLEGIMKAKVHNIRKGSNQYVDDSGEKLVKVNKSTKELVREHEASGK